MYPCVHQVLLCHFLTEAQWCEGASHPQMRSMPTGWVVGRASARKGSGVTLEHLALFNCCACWQLQASCMSRATAPPGQETHDARSMPGSQQRYGHAWLLSTNLADDHGGQPAHLAADHLPFDASPCCCFMPSRAQSLSMTTCWGSLPRHAARPAPAPCNC